MRSDYRQMPTDRKPEFFKGAQLKVGIIGCGYVGLPLALRFAEAGHKVTGFDTDPAKVSMLNAGKSYIEHIQQTKIQQFVNSRHFSANAGIVAETRMPVTTNDSARVSHPVRSATTFVNSIPTPCRCGPCCQSNIRHKLCGVKIEP